MSHDVPTTEQEHQAGAHADFRRPHCSLCVAEFHEAKRADEIKVLNEKLADATQALDLATAVANRAAAERDEARAALELEKAEHLATCNRWIAIEAELKSRIAKARKIMRAHRLHVHPAYKALNAPRGRR